MPEKSQKNVWGASLFICPKMTLMVKKNYEKIIFMDSAQFWVESWYHVSKLTQGGLKYGNLKIVYSVHNFENLEIRTGC